MILQGVVNEVLEARVPVQILDSSGGHQSVEAVIDTGFNGFLTLPGIWIQHLGLKFVMSTTAELADGSIVSLAKYEAIVLWDGRERRVPVLQSESNPLCGMLLLRNCRLTIDVRPRGEALLVPLE